MPTSFAVDTSARASVSPEALRAAFTGELRRPGVRPLYLLGMALVAAAMILLPLLYLGVIIALGYGLYEYVVFGLNLLDPTVPQAAPRMSRGGLSRRGRQADSPGGLEIILFCVPLVAGVVVILFLLKPLFAPRPRRPEPFTLGRDDNPVLYGYVELLCRLMHAPVPKRIDVDEFPNASAGFRAAKWRGGGGVWGLIAGWFWMLKGDVVLTIGLPLAAGMSAQQLTGVLAHEFGHFTQRLAMRLGWIISHINHWLGRIAYERDAWDERLDQWRHQPDLAILVPVILLIKSMIWLTRLALKGLVLAAHAISCFMSRQMEYDADEWQCRVIGSSEFAGMFDQIELLGASAGMVFGGLNDRWRERRMPDDLPLLIAEMARTLPPETRKQVLDAAQAEGTEGAEAAGSRKRSLFDTHPTRPQRQTAALALQAPGVFRLAAPATALFADFSSLCKQVSYNHFKMVLGPAISEVTFVPSREFVTRQEAQVQAANALAEFFLNDELASLVRPRLDRLPVLGDAKETARELVEARKQMVRLLDRAKASMKLDSEAWRTELTTWRARYALGAGLKPAKDELEAGLRSADQAKAASRAAAEAVDARIAAADAFRDASERRINAALALYCHPDAARKIPTATEDLERAEIMVSAYSVLSLCRGASRMIMRDVQCAARMIDHLQNHPKHQDSIEKLAIICREIDSHVTSMRSTMANEPYPFPHAAGQLTMAAFVVGAMPPPDYLLDVVNHAHDCLSRYWTTRQSALMPLVEMTLKMERALGLPPLKPGGVSEKPAVAAPGSSTSQPVPAVQSRRDRER